MRPVVSMPPSLVRRAAAIARGPHACPNCERPTWAEPPVPWVGLRDYVVRCDGCERPLAVFVDRDAIVRRGASNQHHSANAPGMYDPVAELLDQRELRAFARRVLAASPLPILAAGALLLLGASPVATFVVAMLVVVPAALYGPAALVGSWAAGRAWLRTRLRRQHLGDGRIVSIELARWDQWHREEQRHEREWIEQPDAVFEELERVLDERELRRVRALAQRGEVPEANLGDLVRFRRSWRTVA